VAQKKLGEVLGLYAAPGIVVHEADDLTDCAAHVWVEVNAVVVPEPLAEIGNYTLRSTIAAGRGTGP
jgi:hypothetical protein